VGKNQAVGRGGAKEKEKKEKWDFEQNGSF
jgi:hypothetical protein